MPASFAAHTVDDELNRRARVWHETGSVNNSGEFKMWLHIFALVTQPDGDAPHISEHHSLPWVNLMPRPCTANLEAMWHMTRFANYPSDWAMYNDYVAQARNAARTKNCFGPYWMLLPAPNSQRLAQELIAMKHRLRNEMFKDTIPWAAREFERRVVESMEPLLIGAIKDEVDGSGEERSRPV